MSFQLSATVSKASEVKKALEGQREERLQEAARASDAGQLDPDDLDHRRGELDDLAAAGIMMAEDGIRKLKDYSSFQVTVSGHRDTNQQAAVAVSVNAIP